MIIRKKNWSDIIINENNLIETVIKKLNKTAFKIIFIANKNKKLVGTITDGDIRRGILKGLTTKDKISQIINRRPLVAYKSMSREWVQKLMDNSKIDKVPVVDKQGKIIDIISSEKINFKTKENLILIMAGGKGVRLKPLTNLCPKPLLPLGGKPMLEHIILKAKDEGFRNIAISINYLGKMVQDYFGNGKKLGVNIIYLKEKTPLGTAGAMGLLTNKITKKLPFIVTNGDILSDVNFSELLNFHNNEKSMATMSIYKHNWKYPYGVVNTKGIRIVGFQEKPSYVGNINAGVYSFSDQIINFTKKFNRIDMSDLFLHLCKKKRNINAYPIHEPWMDIGTHDQLEIAKNKIKEYIKTRKLK